MGIYRDRLREAVIRMKQRVAEPLTLTMGRLLADVLHRRWDAADRPDLVVPVPAHWWKRIRRGFNGPDLLSESLGRQWGLPIGNGVLYCRRRTEKQGTLLPSERFANVRGAFAVRSRVDLKQAHVLLIDDIMTTGATGSEAAKMLRQAGAARVTLAVVARGVGQDGRAT